MTVKSKQNGSDNLSREKMYNAYLTNLRFALDYVRIPLNNPDTETVAISSDHGNASGEWRIYGHGPGRFYPQVRYVPWAVTSASDTGEYIPQITLSQDIDTTIISQFGVLGYRS